MLIICVISAWSAGKLFCICSCSIQLSVVSNQSSEINIYSCASFSQLSFVPLCECCCSSYWPVGRAINSHPRKSSFSVWSVFYDFFLRISAWSLPAIQYFNGRRECSKLFFAFVHAQSGMQYSAVSNQHNSNSHPERLPAVLFGGKRRTRRRVLAQHFAPTGLPAVLSDCQ
jgi:hypothetical protein